MKTKQACLHVVWCMMCWYSETQ